MNIEFDLPKRRYCGGDKKMVSIRLPEQLMDEIRRLAEEYGRDSTDLITTALDQFVHWTKTEGKRSRRGKRD